MMNPMYVTRSLALALAVSTSGAVLAAAPSTNPIGSVCCRGIDRGGLSELRAFGDARLEAMRGGARAATPVFDDGEREMLRQAQAQRPELAAMRGGDLDLSDRDIKVILITAAVVLILVAIF